MPHFSVMGNVHCLAFCLRLRHILMHEKVLEWNASEAAVTDGHFHHLALLVEERM